MAKRTLLVAGFMATWLVWLVFAWLVAFIAYAEWVFWAMVAAGVVFTLVLARRTFR